MFYRKRKDFFCKIIDKFKKECYNNKVKTVTKTFEKGKLTESAHLVEACSVYFFF